MPTFDFITLGVLVKFNATISWFMKRSVSNMTKPGWAQVLAECFQLLAMLLSLI